MNEHTAGPWVEKDGYIGTCEENSQTIAYLSTHRNKKLRSESETKANGKLIAAAPELLEALEECAKELKAHEIICEIIRQEKMPHSKPFEPSQAMNKAVEILKKVYGN